jgi:hypothetical protein
VSDVWRRAGEMHDSLWVGVTGVGAIETEQRKWFVRHLAAAKVDVLRSEADRLSKRSQLDTPIVFARRESDDALASLIDSYVRQTLDQVVIGMLERANSIEEKTR